MTTFSRSVLGIDPARVAATLEDAIRRIILDDLRRRGAVVGVSGGIDSSVVAALCARALGPERVVVLLMPDRDSSPTSTLLGRLLADHLGVRSITQEITPALAALGCYDRQLEAIRQAVPEYGEGWRCKLSIPSLLAGERLNITSLTVADAGGHERTVRLPPAAYLGLVAATNLKQRTRTVLEYYHADRLGYAVAGTPNRLEHDQGFFVKQGDGASDLTPIAGLYKTQVFALAEHLGLPDDIRARTPTTDTFSLPQTQEEFYFALPWEAMDLCLWAVDHDMPAATVAATLELTAEQVERVFRDIAAKRRVARYLHRAPVAVDPGTA